MKTTNKIWGFIAAALAAIGYALCPTICRFAYQANWSDVSFTLTSVFMATVILFIMCKIKKISLKFTKSEFRQILAASLCSYIGIQAYNTAAGMIPAGATTALNFLYPALILIVSAVCFKLKLTWLMILSAIFNIAGVFLFFRTGENMLLGSVTAVLSAVFFGAYAMVVEHTGLNTIDSFKLAFYVMGLSAVYGLILGLTTGSLSFPAVLIDYRWPLYLGLSANVLGVVFFQIAIRNIGAAQTGLTATLEPLTSIILGAVIFGEFLTLRTGIGCVLIVVGILFNGIAAVIQSKKGLCRIAAS
jgi:drug/metabolite transporter (DMT)-like permease